MKHEDMDSIFPLNIHFVQRLYKSKQPFTGLKTSEGHLTTAPKWLLICVPVVNGDVPRDKNYKMYGEPLQTYAAGSYNCT
jgi:hypothetical protein